MKNIISNVLIKNNKNKLLIPILIIPLLIVGIFFFTKPKKEDETIDDTFRTIFLEKGELYSSVSIKGTILSNEVSSVSTNLNAKVIEVNVKVGDEVKKGDVIAKLDSSDIQREINDKTKDSSNEKKSLQDAYDRLLKQKNSLLEDKRTVENDKNTSINNAKQLLDNKINQLNIAINDLNNVTNEKNKIENIIKPSIEKVINAEMNAQNTYQDWQNSLNYTFSNKNGNESDEDYESRISMEKIDYEKKINDTLLAYNSSQESLKNAQDELSSIKTIYNYENIINKVNDSLTKKESLESEKIDLENSYKSLISDKNNSLKDIDNSIQSLDDNIKDAYKKLQEFSLDGIKELNDKLSETILKAESDGKITELKVNVGSVANGTIATIQSTNKLMISAKVQDYDITKISLGQKVKVTTESSDEIFEGTLTRISPTASTEGDFEVDIKLPVSDKLFIGTKAKAEIILFSKPNVISVPTDAILEKEDGSYIIKKENNTFKEIKIIKGETTEFYTEINGPEVKEGLEILANADWDFLKMQSEESINNNGGF